jgi:sugar phosphate isomerase/epimerase
MITDREEGGSFREWCRWMKDAGFQAVDVPDLTPEVKRTAEEAGLSIGSFDVAQVSALFSRDEGKSAAALESVRGQMARSAELGGKVCFMCLKPEDNAMPRKETFARFKEIFPVLAADAERLGVKIVFEGWPGPAPHYPTLGCTPEVLRAMFEAVPSPALGVNYDPSHLIRLGIDYLRFLREFADRVGHVHAKDCVVLSENVYLYGRHQAAAFGHQVKFSEGPWRYTIPGEGEADWAAIAAELDFAGYEGAVSVELEDHRYHGSVENCRRGLIRTLNHLVPLFR